MEHNNWTRIIKPKSNPFELNLREIWEYRDLLYILIRRDIVSSYKQTLLGPIWFFVQPILTTIVFTIIFSNIARINTENVNPTLFYLAGITFWNYYADCLQKTSGTFLTNASIFGKVYFPRILVPLATILGNLYKFFVQFILLCIAVGVLAIMGKAPVNIQWLHAMVLLPFVILMIGLLGMASGNIISSLTVKYRDFSFLVAFGTQLLMYCTPVIYPLSYAKKSFFWAFVNINPITPLIEAFRYSMLGSGTFTPLTLLYSSAFCILTFTLSVFLFNKVEKNFVDII